MSKCLETALIRTLEAYLAEINELKLRVSALEKALLQAEMFEITGFPAENMRARQQKAGVISSYASLDDAEEDIGTSNLTRQVDDMYP